MTNRSYEPRYFAPLFAIEDRHFWFRSRNSIISAFAKQVTEKLPQGYLVLEAGCGTGNTLRALEGVCERGYVMGMDIFSEGLGFARQRTSCPLLQGDIHHPPFNTRFDLVGLFDVLEHLPNDIDVLKSLYALLKPGGTLLMTVPAYPSLWSYFDEAAHHCRRYTPKELDTKLRTAHFQVEFLSPYMAPLFPLMWAGRRVAALRNRRRADSAKNTEDLAEEELRIIPLLNPLMNGILSMERPILHHRLRLPVGTSLLALARRPKQEEAL